MAASANRRYGSANKRKGRGFGGGWKLLSVLLVLATFAMVFYAWTLTRGDRADASANPAPQATAAKAEPEAETTAKADPETKQASAKATEPTVAAQAADAQQTPPADVQEEAEMTSQDQAGPQADAPVQALSVTGTIEGEPEQPEAVITGTQWPSQQFPGITPFPSASYSVALDGSHADIYLPAGSDADFPEYAKTLTAEGASVNLDNDELTVLILGDVEIQLVPDPDAPMISLCGESAIEWVDPDDVLPQAGRLVSQEAGIDGLGAVLTYRCVSFADLVGYLDLLQREGWVSPDQAKPAGGSLFTQYQRGDRTITIDYYANSTSFQIYLGTLAVG